jgi:thioredoxin 2
MKGPRLRVASVGWNLFEEVVMQGTEMSTVELEDRGVLIACPGCGQRNRLRYERLEQAYRCGKCHTTIRPPAEPIEVQRDQAFVAVVAHSSIPVLVDFWAPWCGPCKMVAPEVTRVAAESSGRVLVLKVNTEELPGLAQRFGISGIPTFILFGNGTEVARQAGAMSAAQLQRFVQGAAR